jgi:hypothetical protein
MSINECMYERTMGERTQGETQTNGDGGRIDGGLRYAYVRMKETYPNESCR